MRTNEQNIGSYVYQCLAYHGSCKSAKCDFGCGLMTLCGIERQRYLAPLVVSKWTGGVGEVSLEVVEEFLALCASAGGHGFRSASMRRRWNLIVIRLHAAGCDLAGE